MAVRSAAGVRVLITELVMGYGKQVTYMVGRKHRQLRDLGKTVIFIFSCFFVLFCFVLFCFCFVLFVLFCLVLFCFVLFCFVLFCFALFCFVLFCFVLFCFVFKTVHHRIKMSVWR